MTRNTKLYKSRITDSEGKPIDVVYRDLTIEELYFINNIKNEEKKREYAAKFSIEGDEDIPWPAQMQIGEIIILKSRNLVEDRDLFELIVRDYRESVTGDSSLVLMSHVCRVFPGTSIIDLMKLNYKDLIELVCLCEIATNKKIFDVAGLVGDSVKKNGKTEFPDDGKTLQEKVKEMKKFG